MPMGPCSKFQQMADLLLEGESAGPSAHLSSKTLSVDDEVLRT